MRFFDVENSLDYYSFGMLMPERNGGGNCGYGYQGTEKGNEGKGEVDSYITHFRQLDLRLGRWLTIDPKASSLPWQSPYFSMDNNPVLLNDVFGDKVEDWVEVNGEVKYDSRVVNQDDATALYGEDAIYRPNGYSYITSDGSNFELGNYGFLKQNGVIKSVTDEARNSLAYTDPKQAKIPLCLGELKLLHQQRH